MSRAGGATGSARGGLEGVPYLSAHDLRADLERAYQRARKHHLFAYFGTGEEQVLKLGHAADVRVVPVRSELELRARLPDLRDEEARVAFLVPWTEDIPLDIAGRFVLNGRVRRIGKAARVKHLFGVSEVEGEVLASPLIDHLLRGESERRYPVADGFLTADTMWAAWLARDWGVPTEGGLALDTLLGWCASDRRGPAFVQALGGGEAEGVRAALAAHLAARLGPAGPAIWAAWESGRAEVALELAVLFEALAGSPLGSVRMWVKTQVRGELGVEREDTVSEVARALGREAGSALRYLERAVSPAEVRALVRAADERVGDDSELRAALAESTRLPTAWSQRLDALGSVLARGAAEPEAETLEEAVRAFRALEGHALFTDPAQKDALKRAEMAVRLLAWLVARPDRALEASPTPHGEAEVLGRWYAEEGGYVDWARHAARCTAASALTQGVAAVVRAADAARTEMDRRFAKSLVGWVEAGEPAHQVVPIRDAVRRVATRFLDERPERRVLVLLMDGMAWAQAVQLLASFGRRAWGPLAWHATRSGRLGEGRYPVVFAALPTVTEVSRSSFFAGKPMKPGARLDTQKDPKQWAANPHVRKYAEGTDVPRLLMRADGHTKAGGASEKALALVADAERRVVAMVLNAIDDSLKASHALRPDWSTGTIASLPDLLDAARDHGRTVLLASDHGHVPSDRLARVREPHPGAQSSGGGARWRPWPSADAPVAEDEVAFAGSKVYAPKGAHGVVLLSDDASVYQGNTHAGEHGGATLAEVVAPCLLVGCAEAAAPAGEPDPALDVQAPFVPRWWHFDVRDEAPPAVVPEAAPAPPPEPEEPPPQLALPIEPKRPTPAPPAPPSPFATSPVLAARLPHTPERQRAIRAVDALRARQGVMSDDAFAAAMELLPFRVRGLISKLQEALNVDGYEVLRHDPQSRQVFLDEEKLTQLFPPAEEAI